MMNRWKKVLVWGLALLVLVSCAPVANTHDEAERTPPAAGSPAEETTPTPEALSRDATPVGEEIPQAPVLASDLLDRQVEGPQEWSGEVRGIVMEGITGQARYLAVSTSSAGGRMALLPWSAVAISSSSLTTPQPAENQGDLQLSLSAAPADFTAIPAVNADALEDGSALEQDWDAEARAYWESQSIPVPVTIGETGEDPGGMIYLSRQALEQGKFSVQNGEGDLLGHLEDVVLNHNGGAGFAIVAAQAGADSSIPIPWNSLAWLSEGQVFFLDRTVDAMQGAPVFSRAEPPDMTIPGWDKEWQQFWQVRAATEEGGAEVESEGLRYPLRGALLVGDVLVALDGTPAGSVIDWLLDPDGNSEYLLVQAADGLIVVPWEAVRWRPDSSQLAFLLDPITLRDAPHYLNPEAVDIDERWQLKAEEFWSKVAPVAAENLQQPAGLIGFFVRAGLLLNQTVLDVNEHTLGTVADLIMSAPGQSNYIVLQTGSQYRPVPWMNFEYAPERGTLIYLDDSSRIAGAPVFSSLEEMDPSQEDWDKEIRSYWGIQ